MPKSLPRRLEDYISTLLVILAVSWIPVSLLVAQRYKAGVHDLCEEKGRLSSLKTVEAEGYLVTKSMLKDPDFHEFMDLRTIAAELLERRFQFLEVPQATRADLMDQPGFRTSSMFMQQYSRIAKGATGHGTKYYRFYLADADDPTCAGFEAEIASRPQYLLDMRLMGLPVGKCIAAVKTNIALSRYERGVVDSERPGWASVDYTWSARHYIRDRHTGKIVAEATTAGYQAGGGGKGGTGFRCKNSDQLALVAKAIVPRPAPSLPARNATLVVDAASDFPVQLKLVADMLYEKDTDKIPVDLSTTYVRPLSTLDGRVFIRDRQLTVIGKDVTKVVPIRAFGVKPAEVEGLTVVGDELIFVGRRGYGRKIKRFDLFRYSLAGDPIAAYQIEVPAFPLDQDIVPLVNEIKVNAKSIEFAVSAFHREGAVGVSYKVFNRDYVFRARLDRAPSL